MGLREYRAKRDFKQTSEPSGGRAAKVSKKSGTHTGSFVIQKHDATRLHYDFRLEMEGTLKSWAVPKGIPTRQGDRRLAIHVEDHPIDYASFEGVIPEGNYGAGSVMVWDYGQFRLLGGSPSTVVDEGKIHFELEGQKLKGEWTLVRIKSRGGEDKDEWLLLKSGENVPDITPKEDDRSARTKRTMRQIAEAADAKWQSNRSTRPKGFKARVAALAHSKSEETPTDPAPRARSVKSAPLKKKALKPARLNPRSAS
ncbi:MAG: hypothetical protein JO317_06355 [Verrucomicrobiae bacterium]|nr:hypothetical protein [Verrucomicrobiae bacterium]